VRRWTIRLTDTLGPPQPTVCHHLRVLFESGLLGCERRGNWVYYRGAAATGFTTAPCPVRWKMLERYLDQPFDQVITVCDQANETCPVFSTPGNGCPGAFPIRAAAWTRTLRRS
jgi:hypothetical protein